MATTTEAFFDVREGTTPGRVIVQNGSRFILIRLDDLLDGQTAYFQEITVCVDGVEKKARVLMTDPYEEGLPG